MSTKQETNAAKGDIEEKVAEAEEQGFLGTKTDPIPNEEYTLTTGPNSPSAFPDDRTRVAQHHVTPKEG